MSLEKVSRPEKIIVWQNKYHRKLSEKLHWKFSVKLRVLQECKIGWLREGAWCACEYDRSRRGEGRGMCKSLQAGKEALPTYGGSKLKNWETSWRLLETAMNVMAVKSRLSFKLALTFGTVLSIEFFC